MDESVGDVMRAYAADAVDIARQKFSIELDYSVESVRQLDAILERYHESVPRGLRKAFSRGPSDAEIAKFAKIWGGYLGEVMRRTWGGTWTLPEQGPMENAYCLEINDILLSPPARAYKRMMIGPEENVFDYVKYLERELAAP